MLSSKTLAGNNRKAVPEMTRKEQELEDIKKAADSLARANEGLSSANDKLEAEVNELIAERNNLKLEIRRKDALLTREADRHGKLKELIYNPEASLNDRVVEICTNIGEQLPDGYPSKLLDTEKIAYLLQAVDIQSMVSRTR